MYGTSNRPAMHTHDGENVYFHLKAKFKPLPPSFMCSLATFAGWAQLLSVV